MSNKKTGLDFQKQAGLLKIKEWDNHPCCLCEYMTKFVFLCDEVFFDSGCDCVGRSSNYSERNWDDVADFYNIQTNPEVIKKFNEFWQFK